MKKYKVKIEPEALTDIRCMLVKKFPYMVHFYINEGTSIIEVLAVISTHRNPKIWKEKTGKYI